MADEYAGRWQIEGDVRALDLTLSDRRVRYGAYPNALEQIANGVDFPRVGRAWATAAVGYEFAATGQTVHRGAGSHGTLHELDSRVPLLIAGVPKPDALRATPRIVDVAPMCCGLLQIPSADDIGAAR